jgi:hypothetical protein
MIRVYSDIELDFAQVVAIDFIARISHDVSSGESKHIIIDDCEMYKMRGEKLYIIKTQKNTFRLNIIGEFWYLDDVKFFTFTHGKDIIAKILGRGHKNDKRNI